MKMLAADDDAMTRRVMRAVLRGCGGDVVLAADGLEVSRILAGPEPPELLVLDWNMPGITGLDLCRRLRARADGTRPYIILVTANERSEEIVAGLEAGADDYVVKPFDPAELGARARVGLRLIAMQRALQEKVQALEEALSRVQQLQGLLPMCAWCRRIRDDGNYWRQLEDYLSTHADVHFTHSFCPECYTKHLAPQGAEPGACSHGDEHDGH